MHPELVRHPADRPNAELVFPADLFEYNSTLALWLSTPFQPASCPSAECFTGLSPGSGPFRSIANGPAQNIEIKGAGRGKRRLKKLLAEAMLDSAALKDILGNNG